MRSRASIVFFICLVLGTLGLEVLNAADFENVALNNEMDVIVQFCRADSDQCMNFASTLNDLETASQGINPSLSTF